ncbi:MAG: glycosyltransferase family 39 protein [Endomicrobia bacterium]|nr:glycosyltransferase family 39 protein [Endomicrobiia bacterium]
MTDIFKKYFDVLFLFVIIIIFYVRLNDVIKRISPTYDEPLHLIQGYAYLKTKDMSIIRPYDQPIFAKVISALGLFLLPRQPTLYTHYPYWINSQRYSFANLMLYHNNIEPQEILNTGRSVIIILSSVFIVFFFSIIKNTFGKLAAYLGIVLYSFNTSVMAHSCLTTQDLLASVFYTLTVYFIYKYVKFRDTKFAIFSNLMLAMMTVTKYSVVVLLSSCFLILLYYFITKNLKLKQFIIFVFLFILINITIGFIVYRFDIMSLYEGLIKTLVKLQEGRSTFFMGKYSIFGFREYFFTLFFLKTELPLLFLFLCSVVLLFYKILKKQVNTLGNILFFNIVFYIVVASFSKTQIGHRHLLPIYPLMIWNVSNIIRTKKCFL